jgi:enoyl-CoA hydratase/carnithine racemase
VNEVVPADALLPAAYRWARRIIECSPDAVTANKKAVLLSIEHAGVETSTIAHARSAESTRLYSGTNIKARAISVASSNTQPVILQEGLSAFVEVIQ